MSPGHNYFANGLDDADRMASLIEAATATFNPDDPAAVQSLFTAQAVALDVIFKEYIKRRTSIFDSMRVALKAQAQCRSTFKSLTEFKNPRPPAAMRIFQNSNEQTIESAKTPA